jgi:hypothetical protein
MKKRFWINSQGLLITSSGNVSLRNAEEISKYRYDKLLKEQKRISNELDENGMAIGSDGTLYLKGFK